MGVAFVIEVEIAIEIVIAIVIVIEIAIEVAIVIEVVIAIEVVTQSCHTEERSIFAKQFKKTKRDASCVSMTKFVNSE